MVVLCDFTEIFHPCTITMCGRITKTFLNTQAWHTRGGFESHHVYILHTVRPLNETHFKEHDSLLKTETDEERWAKTVQLHINLKNK